MSFGISAAGYVQDVIDKVQSLEGSGDTSQLDAVKAYIVAELEAWPSREDGGGALGVMVEASGHHDGYMRSVMLSIKPLYLMPR